MVGPLAKARMKGLRLVPRPSLAFRGACHGAPAVRHLALLGRSCPALEVLPQMCIAWALNVEEGASRPVSCRVALALRLQ